MRGAILLAALASVPADAGARPAADTPEVRDLYEKSLTTLDTVNKEHGHFTEVNGIRMHYLEWGDRKATPLIWAHALFSNAFEMYGVAPALVDAGYHLYAITYRGHGQTEAGASAFSLADIADDIDAFMKREQLPCAVLGGWSFGGGVVTTFYENYPAKAMGIVLEDGGGIPIHNHVATVFAARSGQPTDERWESPGISSSRYQAYLVRKAAGSSDAGPARDSTRRRVEALVDQSSLRRTPQGEWSDAPDIERLMGPWNRLDPRQTYQLPLLAQSWNRVHPLITYRRLAVPMLIFDPTADDKLPYGVGHFTPYYEALRASHPDLIQRVEYPDATHEDSHLGNVGRFVRDMSAFRDRIRAASADRCFRGP